MKKAKKLVAILLAVCLTAALAACASSGSAKITKLGDLEGKTVAFMAVPIPVERFKVQLEEDAGVTFKEVLYFDSFQAAIAALKSGKTDAVNATEPVANYYTARNKDLTSITLAEAKGTFRMALRADDTELLARINAALLEWTEDGTLDALAEEFVTGLTPDKQLEGKQLPHFDDAPTLYIGLSGDNPPVDYVAADGKPAGYNAELLYMLSEALNINFEISIMPLETKFPALASGKIDIFFLHMVGEDIKATTQTMDENKDVILTEPYYTFDSTMLLVLK